MKHNWEYTQGDKTSVRIHNAPGGNSQISLGWSDDKPQNQSQKSYQNQVQTYQTSYQKQSYDGYYGNVPNQGISAGAPTKQKDFYGGGGGRAAVPQYYEQQDRHRQEEMYRQNEEKTSVKIHNPPGGKSNFSYGFEEQPAQKAPYYKQQDQNQKSYGQDNRWDQGYQQNSYQEPITNAGRKKNQAHYADNNIFGGYQQQQEPSPPRQAFQYKAPMGRGEEPVFGQRNQSGNNCGPTTEKSSVKLHAPPGGKSSIQFF